MTTGLFPIRQTESGRRPQGRASHDALQRKRRDALAEALADGAPSIRAAAKQIGVAETMGRRLFAEIRAGLGWQAV